jgi:hypothetical protein
MLKCIYLIIVDVLFDPIKILKKWSHIPQYTYNRIRWKQQADDSFPLGLIESRFLTWESAAAAGTAKGHYFWQDLWVSRRLHSLNVQEHVDVGSRVDGFVAHVLTFAAVKYVDVRALSATVPDLQFIKASITQLPFEDNSIKSLSCLHVLEHIGLGRYGDPIDFEGHIKGIKELIRVLAHDGTLYLSVPVGRQRVVFDAHRIFETRTITEIIKPARIAEFHLIPDSADRVIENASLTDADRQNYGCGIFVINY